MYLTFILHDESHFYKKYFAVLNGHYFGSTYQIARFDDNGDGKLDRTAYQICTDYQDGWHDGAGTSDYCPMVVRNCLGRWPQKTAPIRRWALNLFAVN